MAGEIVTVDLPCPSGCGGEAALTTCSAGQRTDIMRIVCPTCDTDETPE